MDSNSLSIDVSMESIHKLKPAEYNPRRRLSLGERRALRNSIEKFGMVYPIVVNKRNNVIVGGHQRYAELMDMGIEEVPVVWVDMDEEQEKRANIQLNSIEADWDIEKLQEVVYPWTTDEVENVGFTRVEASALLAGIYMNPDSKAKMLEELRAEREAMKQDKDELPQEEEDEEILITLTCPKCGHKGLQEEFMGQNGWKAIEQAVAEANGEGE